MKVLKPFLRWAGGKTWLVSKIQDYLPSNFNAYHEPFLGGASIYFHLKSTGRINQLSHLSDLNGNLIEAYECVRDYPDEIITRLSELKNNRDFYYKIRSAKYDNPLDRATQFLYLNRTSFNGIYRVNLAGEYNVPFGNRNLAQPFDFDNLRAASLGLANTKLVKQDFWTGLDNIKENDLVFLDPPYTVAHENNGFIKYNQQIFAWEDQVRLQSYINEVVKKGAYFIMTNASHVSIKNLYKPLGKHHQLRRASLIGGRGAKREEYNEVIFTNINQL